MGLRESGLREGEEDMGIKGIRSELGETGGKKISR